MDKFLQLFPTVLHIESTYVLNMTVLCHDNPYAYILNYTVSCTKGCMHATCTLRAMHALHAKFCNFTQMHVHSEYLTAGH